MIPFMKHPLAIAMALSLLAHTMLWTGNNFTIGQYPWLDSLVLGPTHEIRPLAMMVLVVVAVLVISAIRGLVISRPPDDIFTKFIRSPRRWHNMLLEGLTTKMFIGLMLPITLILAGPLSPALIESANLFTVYLLTWLTMAKPFTARQVREQMVWLTAMVCGAIAFTLLVKAQQEGTWHASNLFAEVWNSRMALAMAFSIVAHLVFWFGCFFAMGHFPRVQAFVYQNSKELPRLPAYGLMLACFVGLIWFTYGKGAEGLLSEDVSQHLTNQAYLARWLVYDLAFALPLSVVFPLMITYAGARAPVIICLGNIIVMVLLLTVLNPAVMQTLTWRGALILLAAFGVLTLTALGFVRVQQKHEAELLQTESDS